MKRRFWFIPIVLMLALFTACQEPVEVEKIVFDKTELTLTVGSEETLKADVLPPDAENPALSWKSSDDSIVTVDSTGKIKAIAKGTAIIMASTANGVKAECNVKVIIPATSVKIVEEKVFIDPNDNKKLELKVEPIDANDLVWTSSDETIAKVSSDGTVTGIRAGEVTISVGNGVLKDTCLVIVKGIALDPTAFEYASKNEVKLPFYFYTDNMDAYYTFKVVTDPKVSRYIIFGASDSSPHRIKKILKLGLTTDTTITLTITCKNYSASCRYVFGKPTFKTIEANAQYCFSPADLTEDIILLPKGMSIDLYDWCKISTVPEGLEIPEGRLKFSSDDPNVVSIDPDTGRIEIKGKVSDETAIHVRLQGTDFHKVFKAKIVNKPEKIEIEYPYTHAVKDDPAMRLKLIVLPAPSVHYIYSWDHGGDNSGYFWDPDVRGDGYVIFKPLITGKGTVTFNGNVDIFPLQSVAIDFELIPGSVDVEGYYHYDHSEPADTLRIPLRYNNIPIKGLSGIEKPVKEIVLDPMVNEFIIKSDAFIKSGGVAKLNIPVGVTVENGAICKEMNLKCVYAAKGSKICAGEFSDCDGLNIYTDCQESDKPIWAEQLGKESVIHWGKTMTDYNNHGKTVTP